MCKFFLQITDNDTVKKEEKYLYIYLYTALWYTKDR